MVSEPGKVIRSGNGEVEIACQVQSACHSCKAKSTCGTSALAKVFPGKKQVVKISSEQRFEPGQEVQLNIAELALLKASMVVYGIPLLGILLGAILGFQLSPQLSSMIAWLHADLAAILGALLGLVIGLISAKIIHQRLSRSGQFQLSIK